MKYNNNTAFDFNGLFGAGAQLPGYSCGYCGTWVLYGTWHQCIYQQQYRPINLSTWICPLCNVVYTSLVTKCECSKHAVDNNYHGPG